MTDLAEVRPASRTERPTAEIAVATELAWPAALALLVAFVAIWSVYGIVSHAPSAIHNDTAEAYIWGHEFQLGYYKHPPFWAWVAGLWFMIFPNTDWSFAILTTLNAGLGLCGSWVLIGDFVRGQRRRTAAVLLLLTPFYTFLAFKYNANSIFLSIWPWAMHCFVRSIDSRRLSDAVWFGAFMAMTMLSKYFALILGVTCLVGAFMHPARRRYFACASPYVSVAVGLVLCAPHAWWLARSGFPPFQYFSGETGKSIASGLYYAVYFVIGLLAAHSVVALVIAIASRTLPRDWIASVRARWPDPRFRLLVTLVVLPLLLTVAAGLALRLKVSVNMTIGACSLVPLLLIEVAGKDNDERLYRLACRSAMGLTLAALVLAPAIAIGRFRLATDFNDTQPRKELAREATAIWRAATAAPLGYVAADDPWSVTPYGNAIAFYSPDRPHAFTDFDFHRAPWVTPAGLGRRGLLAVCVKGDDHCQALSRAFSTPRTTQKEITLAHVFWGRAAPPVTFVLTIVPPRS